MMLQELQTSEIIDPKNDRKAVADHTLKLRLIFKIKENIEILFTNAAGIYPEQL